MVSTSTAATRKFKIKAICEADGAQILTYSNEITIIIYNEPTINFAPMYYDETPSDIKVWVNADNMFTFKNASTLQEYKLPTASDLNED